MVNNEEQEKAILSGEATGKLPLFIRLARLVNGWNEFVIVQVGSPETKEWKYMTDKQRAAYLKEMLKEYE
jgi:hypothetical protein